MSGSRLSRDGKGSCESESLGQVPFTDLFYWTMEED